MRPIKFYVATATTASKIQAACRPVGLAVHTNDGSASIDPLLADEELS